MSVPGSTSVWNSPSTSPPRTLTAPISVIALSFGEPPVVSRSTTTKVTPDSGVPRSSMVACWYLTPGAADPGATDPGAADPGGAPGPATGGRSGADTDGADRNGTVRNATARTLGAGSDSPREARGARVARRAGTALLPSGSGGTVGGPSYRPRR